MHLTDKIAVVLGASAEGGTGWAIAEALAAEGAKVVVAARRREPLQRLAERIGGHVVVCDAADPAQIMALAEAASARFGAIDIAVNAAGQPFVGTIADISDAAIQKSLDINFIGQVHFIRRMAAVMTDGGRSRCCPALRRRNRYRAVSPTAAPRPLWTVLSDTPLSNSARAASG